MNHLTTFNHNFDKQWYKAPTVFFSDYQTFIGLTYLPGKKHIFRNWKYYVHFSLPKTLSVGSTFSKLLDNVYYSLEMRFIKTIIGKSLYENDALLSPKICR